MGAGLVDEMTAGTKVIHNALRTARYGHGAAHNIRKEEERANGAAKLEAQGAANHN